MFKKITFITTVILTLCTNKQFAQTWQNVYGFGVAAGSEVGTSACTDASNNFYYAGTFGGSSDFDPTAGVNNLTYAGITDFFVTKYNSAGVYQWAIGGGGASQDAINGVCTDGTSVYVTGRFTTSATFGSATLTANGAGTDAFVAKLNASTGTVSWAINLGATAGGDNGYSICLDGSGNPYVFGIFNGSATMGATVLTATGGSGTDIFVAKLNPANGAVVWVSGGGSTAASDAVGGGGICFVPSNNTLVLATSYNTGAATYGTFGPLANSGVSDACVVTLNASTGAFLSATGIGSAGNDECLGACYDATTGDVFMCGYYNNAVTFPGTSALPTSAGGDDAFVVRYSVSSGNFVWAKNGAGSGTPDHGNGICVDAAGPIVVGGFRNTLTIGSLSLTSANLDDIFVARFNASGTEQWVAQGSGTSATTGDIGRGIAVNSLGRLGVTGQYATACTFGSTVLNSVGSTDIFIAQLLQPLTATQSQVNLTCNGVCNGIATVIPNGGTSPYTYAWSPSGGSGATASSLCATNYTCTITDANSTVITKTFSITQPSAITSSTASQTNVSCNGGSNGAATITASGGTGTLSYNWTPGNPTGDGTVSVTGLTFGTWTCTITDANSCTHTQTVTITQPSALVVSPVAQTNIACNGGSSGAASVSVSGGTTAYSYNWTPGNPSGDGTASVTGLTAGNWTCTVTDANSCTAVQTFTLTQPAALVVTPVSQTNIACNGGSNGAASVSVSGGTTAYSYNWTPGNPTGDGTASVTGLTAGNWTCTVTDANACTSAKTFTVTQPNALTSSVVSQTNISCNGGSNGVATISASNGTPGYTYSWAPSGGTGTTASGLTVQVYTCTITDANSCTKTQTVSITQPSAITSSISSQTNISCNGGSNGVATISASGGTGSLTYAWSPSGGTAATASGLSVGNYTCTITDANSCTKTQTVSITQPSAITSSISSQTNISCNGGSNGAATISASGGTGTLTYAWSPSGGTAATASGLSVGNYTCTITDANSCTKTQTVSITQPSAITSSISSQTNVSCNGGSNGAATVSASGGTGSLTYAWAPSGGTSATASGLTTGNYTCTITDANSCTKTQTVSITQPSAISSSVSSQTNVSCSGGSNGAATVSASGGTGSLTYAWSPSGGSAATASSLTAGNYTCTITDANSCTATQTVSITQPAAVVPAVSIAISSGVNPECSGTSITFSATPTNGGTTPAYQWKVNGGNVGTNSTSFTSTTLLNGDLVTCVLTSNAACASPTTATSTAITMTVTTSVVPSVAVAISSGANPECSGSSITFSATPTNGGATPSYQWKVNGGNVGTNSTSFTSTTIANGDLVTCVLTSNAACASPTTGTSTAITMTVNPIITPSISIAITSGTNPECSGSSITFSASPTNGGSSPSYQWKVSGLNVGTNSPTYTTNTSANNDFITCVLTSNAACTSLPTATSSAITMTVNANVTPAVNTVITSGSNPSCPGATVTFSASPINGGTTPAYQWKLNGTNVGTNSTSYTSTTLANSDVVTCVLTSNANCASPTTGTSSPITMTVNASVTPAVSIAVSSGTNPLCAGASITFSATPTNGGATPSYQWKVNGTNVGVNNSSYTSATLANSDVVTCVLTSNATCASPATATSSALTMTVNPNLTPAVSISIVSGTNPECAGSSITFSATPTNGGTTPNYQWKVNPTNVGTNSSTYTSSSFANGDQVTCVITSNATCLSQPSGTSSITTMTVNPILVPAVSIAIISGTNPQCFGSSITFSSTPTNGGSSPAYQWQVNGGNVGTNSASYSSAALANNDVVTCILTSNALCVSPTTASKNVVMVVNSPVSFTQTPILCAGGNITVGTHTYSTSGTYTDVLTAANGCDSTVTTNLTVRPAISSSQSPTVCAGANITVGIHTYTTTGTYTDVLTAASGCDSTVTTNLNVRPAISSSQSPTVCSGSNITVGTHTYTTSGTYTDVLTATNGCDSTVTTNLTVSPAISSSQSPTVCAGGIITVGTHTYTATGTYTDIFSAVNGCDSTVTTNLIVNSPITTSQNVGLCNGQTITVGTHTYNATGAYIDILSASNGCDSTVTTNLVVNSQITNTVSPQVCFGGTYSVGTHTYTSSGTYVDTLTAAAGCDSIVTTNLTVNNAVDVSVTVNGSAITANATGATYQWVDCNNANAIIPGETNQTYTATSNGNYAVIVTQNSCSDTSVCSNIITTGVSQYSSLNTQYSVYPNPFSENVTLSLSKGAQVKIYNCIGELVMSNQLEAGATELNLTNQNPGVYFIKITINNNSVIKKLIKQ